MAIKSVVCVLLILCGLIASTAAHWRTSNIRGECWEARSLSDGRADKILRLTQDEGRWFVLESKIRRHQDPLRELVHASLRQVLSLARLGPSARMVTTPRLYDTLHDVPLLYYSRDRVIIVQDFVSEPRDVQRLCTHVAAVVLQAPSVAAVTSLMSLLATKYYWKRHRYRPCGHLDVKT